MENIAIYSFAVLVAVGAKLQKIIVTEMNEIWAKITNFTFFLFHVKHGYTYGNALKTF